MVFVCAVSGCLGVWVSGCVVSGCGRVVRCGTSASSTRPSG